MSYRNDLQRWFGHLPLEIDDLFLLERFQLLSLPERAPLVALRAVLSERPRLCRFIATRCPELVDWLEGVVLSSREPGTPRVEHEQTLLWELADLLVYQRFPDAYEQLSELRWNAASLEDICALEGATVIDAGAGTGWLSEELAFSADLVYAVEPVGRLREYIRERAERAKLSNLYAVDGFLHRIPLPDSSADVLVTSRAIGWRLGDELAEIERVVRTGGWAIHCVGIAENDPCTELDEALEGAGYSLSRYLDGGGWRRRYAKKI